MPRVYLSVFHAWTPDTYDTDTVMIFPSGLRYGHIFFLLSLSLLLIHTSIHPVLPDHPSTLFTYASQTLYYTMTHS